MVYLLDVTIDYNQITEPLDKILPLEWEQTKAMAENGSLLGIWRKASAKGVIAIWNMESHEDVSEQIRKMPLYPYMSDIQIEPLIAHPKYPQFCESLLNNQS